MTDFDILKDYCMRADLVDSRQVLKVLNSQATIEQLSEEAHDTAKIKGWWDRPRSIIECLALVHCEVSEAIESYRKGSTDGIVEELADCLIRIFDLCGAHGWDLQGAVKRKMAFNKTRSYRHGGKLA